MRELLMRFLPLILGVVSPQLHKSLEDLVSHLEAEAKKTENEWDDYFAAALRVILLGK